MMTTINTATTTVIFTNNCYIIKAGSELTKPANATLEIFKITPESAGHIQLLNKELFCQCKDLFCGLLGKILCNSTAQFE